MNDGEALLRAIIGDPADDLPRLAYADWCDERGDEARAEFIRVQIEDARLRPLDDYATGAEINDSWTREALHVRLSALRKRERVILSDHAHVWFRDAFPWCEPPGEALFAQWWSQIGRGFLSIVRCPLQAWLDHGKAICAAHPVERVELSDRKPHGVEGVRRGWWGSDSLTHGPDNLPVSLWKALRSPHMVESSSTGGGWKWYDSGDDAIDGLSEGCICWARLPKKGELVTTTGGWQGILMSDL